MFALRANGQTQLKSRHSCAIVGQTWSNLAVGRTSPSLAVGARKSFQNAPRAIFEYVGGNGGISDEEESRVLVSDSRRALWEHCSRA